MPKTKRRKTRKMNRVPIRYRRSIPSEMVRVDVSLIGNDEIKCGTLFEFRYGNRKPVGVPGGWHFDPKPRIIVFYDDGVRYIEGLNTNYLSDYYIRKLKKMLLRFPGIDGIQLYKICKKTARYAIKKGYRKYIRDVVSSEYVFMYEEQLARLIDEPFVIEDDDEYN